VRSDNASELPKVAVIIPVYNDDARLTLCLEALKRQSFPEHNFEVLVVDNGPSEGVRKICAAWPNVRYLVEERRGSYAARNTGLQHIRAATIVAFLDSDCLPKADWLSLGVARLRSMEKCDFLGGRVQIFVRNPAKQSVAELYERVVAFPQKKYVEEGGWAVTANLFVRSYVFDSVGNFDDTLQSGGDMEWGKRATKAGMRLCYAEDVVVRHPARAKTAELRDKVQRVAGGSYARLVKQSPSFYAFARKLVKDLLVWKRDVRRRIQTSQLGATDKGRVYALWGYLKYVRFKEFIRLRIASRRGVYNK